MIDGTVSSGSTIYTDENKSYSGLNKKEYKHETVNHGLVSISRNRFILTEWKASGVW